MNAARIVVVGRSSLLARVFATRYPALVVRIIGHAEAGAAAFEGATCIVNFAFAPGLETSPYDPLLDIDLRVAQRAARIGCHYIMISSRRVYETRTQWNAVESLPAPGMDAYGRNKARIEGELRAFLGDRLTVLRPGNILCYEPVAGRRRFGAYLQHQLVAGSGIRLTVDPSARRDLVPVEFFCEVVAAAALRRIPGVFNVGAGSATRVGDAARWLLEGYGGGELLIEASQPPDEFQLDCARLKAATGLACEEGAVERALRAIGGRLARER